MANRDFRELIGRQWDAQKFLCVGLDSELEKLPASAARATVRETLVGFNRAIIDATKDIAGSYKPNSAFYEAHGEEGWAALRETIQYIHEAVPDVPVILDAKRADIGNTNTGYARAIFDDLEADAVTVHPYLGAEAIEPFLTRTEKGIFILCRTSNAGSGEFQDMLIDGEPLYKIVARHVVEWNKNGNCGLVVGATYPEEMAEVRNMSDDLPFLIPGIGAQGGDLERTVSAAKDSHGRGMIIAASRAIIFASTGENFADAARTKAQELDGAIKKGV